jgi:hypothetical protein
LYNEAHEHKSQVVKPSETTSALKKGEEVYAQFTNYLKVINVLLKFPFIRGGGGTNSVNP